MLVRIKNARDIAAGRCGASMLPGTKVTIARVDGHLHAFDDTCTHKVLAREG